ncbi:MAG: hypothetical protein ACRETD_09040 [Steroidobacteraceae bacterium]
MGNDPKNISGGQFGNAADEFRVQSQSSAVGFDLLEVQPPSRVYIGLDDQLSVQFIGANYTGTATVCLRIMRPDGVVVPIVLTVPANGTTAPIFSHFPLTEGFLLGLAASLTTAPTSYTPAYIAIGLTRPPFGADAVSELLYSGYLNSQISIGWPESVPTEPQEGSGKYASFIIGNPAVGADWYQAVTVGERWRVVSLSATLTTGVAVANRFPVLELNDGVRVYARIPPVAAQVASTVVIYTWGDALPYAAAVNGDTTAPLPSNLILPAGHFIFVTTTGITAADQWSSITALLGEWAEPL